MYRDRSRAARSKRERFPKRSTQAGASRAARPPPGRRTRPGLARQLVFGNAVASAESAVAHAISRRVLTASAKISARTRQTFASPPWTTAGHAHFRESWPPALFSSRAQLCSAERSCADSPPGLLASLLRLGDSAPLFWEARQAAAAPCFIRNVLGAAYTMESGSTTP